MTTDTNHKTTTTSTACTSCREWERDMKGTVATLNRERQTSKELLESLENVIRICEAMRFTTGLGKGQLERIETARKVISKAKGLAA